jgi:hypothetical protein
MYELMHERAPYPTAHMTCLRSPENAKYNATLTPSWMLNASSNRSLDANDAAEPSRCCLALEDCDADESGL